MSKSNSEDFIREIFVQNFKSLKSVRLEVRPLTLLVGMNSSGKSSVFQSILTLVQWVKSGSSMGNFELNGNLVRPGKFGEVLTNVGKGNNTSMGEQGNEKQTVIKLGLSTTHQSVSLGLSQAGDPDSGPTGEQLGFFRLGGEQATCEIEITGNVGKLRFSSGELEVDQWDKVLPGFTQSLRFQAFEGDFYFSPNRNMNKSLFEELSGFTLLGKSSFLVDVLDELSRIRRILTENQSLNGSKMKLDEALNEVCLWIESDTKGESYRRTIQNLESTRDLNSKMAQRLIEVYKSSLESWERATYSQKFLRYLSDMFTADESTVFSCTPSFISNPSETSEVGGISGLAFQDIKTVLQFLVQDSRFELPSVNLDEINDQLSLARYLISIEKSYRGSFLEDIFWDPILEAQIQIEDQYQIEATRWRTPVHHLESEGETLRKKIFNMAFLGPLRKAGFHVSSLDVNRNSTFPLGFAGELTPEVIEVELGSKTISERPIFIERTKKWEIQPATFAEAINSWFRLFTTPSGGLSVESTRLGKYVTMKEKTLDQYGTGASQVLPILALVLTRKPGDVVFIEQPELHLHPGGQQYLADFFMAATSLGIQIVIETHSEYMVNRIRRGVVFGITRREDVQIVNFELNEDGLTQVDNVGLTKSGGFEDWPRGFFAQTEEDLLSIIEELERDAR